MIHSLIVIVHYGNAGPTIAVANTVADFATTTVVVANDLSSRPRELRPEVEWQVPERNLGYGAAFMAAVRGRPSQACVVLNTDLIIDRVTFDRCMDALWSRPDVGIVGPVLRYEDGSLQSGAGIFLGWRRAPYAKVDPGTEMVQCEWVTGAALFVRREVVEQVGIDGSFFLGAEDVDLCLRAGRAGWRVLCCGNAPATHYGGKVIAGPRWSYYATRNRVWLARASFGIWPAVLNWFWALAMLPRVVCADVVKRRNMLSSRLTVMALRHALWSKPDAAQGPLPDEPLPARIMHW